MIRCILDQYLSTRKKERWVSAYAIACDFYREDRRHVYRGWGVFHYMKKKRKPKRDTRRAVSVKAIKAVKNKRAKLKKQERTNE